MRAKLNPLSALLAGTLAVLAAGCQTYDFEPVEPLAIAQTTVETVIKARKSKPNIMLLVDTSGSMTEPVDSSNVTACTWKDPAGSGKTQYPCGGNAPCDPTKCPTRWTDLQAAMGPFLTGTNSTKVRYGLTTYPTPPASSTPTAKELCAPAQGTTVRQDMPTSAEDDASLQANASAINDILQGIPNFGTGQPVGGTPTSLSLDFVSGLPSLNTGSEERDQIILLLTDGLPNCNENNEYSGEQVAECQCTVGSQCATVNGAYYRRGCLDKNATVRAISSLKNDKKVSTIVIGFGAETGASNALDVLNAMAEEGGFARTCKSNADCGTDAADTCDTATNLCKRRFYQAGNQAELAKALAAISERVVVTDACLIKLEPGQAPSDPALIVVYVNGEATQQGADTWTLTDQGVVFNGATCEKIKASRPDAPVNLEVRAIRQR